MHTLNSSTVPHFWVPNGGPQSAVNSPVEACDLADLVSQLFDIMMCVPQHCMVWTSLQSTPQGGPVIWQTLSVVRYYDVCATTLHGLGESAVHSPVGVVRYYDACATTLHGLDGSAVHSQVGARVPWLKTLHG